MKRIITAAALILLITEALFARGIKIAVMDFKTDGVDTSTGRKISALIRSDLINSNKFIVLERVQSEQKLKEQDKEDGACTDIDCALRAAKALSAEKILLGTVMGLEGSTVISGRIVDVKKGIAEFSIRETAANKKDVVKAVDRFTAKLTRRIEGQAAADGKPVVTKEKKNPEKSAEKALKKSKKKNLLNWDIIAMIGQVSDIPVKANELPAKKTTSYGFSFNVGIETSWFHHSLFFLYCPTQKYGVRDLPDPFDKSESIGGGYAFYVRLWKIRDIFTFSLGGFAGYISREIWNPYFIDDQRKGYFGPLMKFEVGKGRYYFYTEVMLSAGNRKNSIGEGSFGLVTCSITMGLKYRIYTF